MLKNIKAIFVDSEGTLRDENRIIEASTIEAIDSLREQKIPVIIVSGLPRFIVRNIQKKSHTSNIIVCSNGADIYDTGNEIEISSHFISRDILYELWKEYHETFTFILAKGDTEYASDISEYNEHPLVISGQSIRDDFYQCHISQKRLGHSDNVGRELEILRANTEYDLEKVIGPELTYALRHSENLTDTETRILIRLKRFIELKRAQMDIMNAYQGDIILANQSMDFAEFQFEGETPWFSLNRGDVSKGNGIINVCEHMGISREEVMAFGNDHNDRTMVDVAGVFACPSNSCKEILDRSKYIYSSSDGISKVFRKVLEEHGKNNN